VCPEDGVIFGHHRHDVALRRAAKLALPKDDPRADVFTGAHLRSARITHWVDDGGPLTGIQQLVGHLHLVTTAKYVRASERAAEEVHRKASRR
jgi:site-specific recombinase XerD